MLFPYGSNLLDQIKQAYLKELETIERQARNWEKKWEELNPLPEDAPQFEGIEKECIMWEVSQEIDEAYKAKEIINEKISAIGQVIALQTAYDTPLTVSK